jgi:hypothetical protein
VSSGKAKSKQHDDAQMDDGSGSGDNNNLSSPNVVEEKKVFTKKNDEIKSGKKLFVSDFYSIFFRNFV